MLLAPGQLAAHLQGPLSPLYILHGDEPLLVLEAADAIRAAARRAGFDQREVLVAGQGFRWTELDAAASNRSLFGGDTLIDLRIPTGKPGKEGADALSRHAASVASVSGVLTLVTLPELDWQTRKAAWFTVLQKAGVALEFNAPALAALPAWIAGRLARQNQSASPDALECIASQVEGNLLAAHQEILKLGLLYPPGVLSRVQIEEAVLDVARYDVDQLRAALLAGDGARCARLLAGLRAEDTAPPLILWALAQETRTLVELKLGIEGGASLDAACASKRIYGARQGPYRAALARCSMPLLRLALLQAARIDRMIKGVARGDLWDEFLQLALRLSRTSRVEHT